MLVFAANDGTNGKEFWISDGTGAGTQMVKDINPDSGTGSFPKEFTTIGSTVFFSARDEAIDYELWKSDGSESGTVMVKSIAPADRGSYPADLEVMNGTLFFRADDGGVSVNHGKELWKSDGTTAGTMMVKDIIARVQRLMAELPDPCRRHSLFQSNTPDQGTWGGELWKSDGTEGGTVMVKDIYPNPNPTNWWPVQSDGCPEFTCVCCRRQGSWEGVVVERRFGGPNRDAPGHQSRRI